MPQGAGSYSKQRSDHLTRGLPDPTRELTPEAKAEYFRFIADIPSIHRNSSALNVLICEAAQLSAQLIRLYQIADSVEPVEMTPAGAKMHPVFASIASLNAKLCGTLSRAKLTPQWDARTAQHQRRAESDPLPSDPEADWRDQAKQKGLM